MAENRKSVNEVNIEGVLSTEQVSATFSKQVLLINAKDTKDNQWKEAKMEVYVKPELLNQVGAAEGDKIVVHGWLAFNFWNGRSFPRVVATSVELIEKGANPAAQAQQPQQPQQAPNVNPMQQQGTMVPPQPQQPVQQPAPNVPNVPNVPPMPGIPG